MKIAGVILGFLILGAGAMMFMDRSDSPSKTEESGPVKQVVLPVEGMTCEGCAVSIKMALKDLDGVKETKVDVEKGQTTVTFAEGKVTTEQLINAINSTGFTARKPDAG